MIRVLLIAFSGLVVYDPAAFNLDLPWVMAHRDLLLAAVFSVAALPLAARLFQ